jgi:signal transduction histidine kinase
MEMGTLDEPPETSLDALYAEAEGVLGTSTDQLRALTERLRRAHATDARGRRLVARLELAVRDVEQCWLFLKRGGEGDGDGTRPDTDGLSGAAIELLAQDVLDAQEEERTRIAEELHDGPAQALANVSFQVEIIDRTLRDDAGAAATEVDALRAMLDRELDRLRGFIHQLRPPLLEDGGLDEALEENARQLDAEGGLTVEVHLEAPADVLEAQERMAILRVAQEAMRNVRKHSGAQHAWLATSFEGGSAGDVGGSWIMEVRDDGHGFDVETASSGTDRHHFGLRFMRERAALIGGLLEIVSEPGQGSVVRLTLDPGERSQRQ